MTESQYAKAGVDLAAADDAKTRIGKLVASTRTPLSVGEIGAFGGMLRVPAGMKKPVLVMSTDGVGTKVLVATQTGKLDTVLLGSALKRIEPGAGSLSISLLTAILLMVVWTIVPLAAGAWRTQTRDA